MQSSSPASKWTAENRRFIEAGGNTTHDLGLGRMIGRIFALLYLSPASVCLEDIASRLNVSKASVSIAVRQLLSFRAVHHEVFPGDRRDFYKAETDFLQILRSGIMPGLRKKLQSAARQIDRTLAASGVETTSTSSVEQVLDADQAEIQHRLRRAQHLHHRIDTLLSSDLFSRLL